MPDGLTGQTGAESSHIVSASEPDSINERSARSRLPSILTALFLLVLIYPLSVGPVAKYYKRRPIPRAVVNFYAPLQVLADELPPVEGFFEWYLDFWGVN